MYIVIAKDKNLIPSFFMFDSEDEALEKIKVLAENGCHNIHLSREIPFEIERTVSVRIL